MLLVFSLVAAHRGCSPCGVRAPGCSGSSGCRAQTPERGGLSSWGARALEPRLRCCDRLSCSTSPPVSHFPDPLASLTISWKREKRDLSWCHLWSPPLCSPLTLQPWDQLCPPRGGSVGKLRAAVSLRGHSHSWEEALEPGTWGGTGLVGECRVQAGLLDFSLTVRNLLPPCPSCWAPWGWASCPHCTRCPEEV